MASAALCDGGPESGNLPLLTCGSFSSWSVFWNGRLAMLYSGCGMYSSVYSVVLMN